MKEKSALPNFELEKLYSNEGFKVIVGVDEAGRGSIAGPVTAGAVIFTKESFPHGLDDSKKLSPQQRTRIFEEIKETALFSFAHVPVEDIERINILQAALKAMTLAVDSLHVSPDLVLVDGNWLPPNLPCKGVAVVKGDQKSLTIAAASVVAKVNRDNLMGQLAKVEPVYGWDTNMGYGTRKHLQALGKFGPSRHHRKSFLPLRKLFED